MGSREGERGSALFGAARVFLNGGQHARIHKGGWTAQRASRATTAEARSRRDEGRPRGGRGQKGGGSWAVLADSVLSVESQTTGTRCSCTRARGDVESLNKADAGRNDVGESWLRSSRPVKGSACGWMQSLRLLHLIQGPVERLGESCDGVGSKRRGRLEGLREGGRRFARGTGPSAVWVGRRLERAQGLSRDGRQGEAKRDARQAPPASFLAGATTLKLMAHLL